MKSPKIWVTLPKFSAALDLLKVKDQIFVCPNTNCYREFPKAEECSYHSQYLCDRLEESESSETDAGNKSGLDKIKIEDVKSEFDSEIKKFQNYCSLKTRNYICPNQKCFKSYRSKYTLTRHLKYECNKSPRFKCFYCDFKNCFKDRVRLHSHIKHPGKKLQFIVMGEE